MVIPDPLTRTTIEILFNRVTTTWIPWNKDIFDTMPYKNFYRSHSELYPSIFTLKDSLTHTKNITSSPTTTVSPHDLVYVEIHYYNIIT